MADGFTWQPPSSRWTGWSATSSRNRRAPPLLIETWLGEGLCREAVVNLKLPMKQRYAEVRRLLDRMEATFKARKIRVSIACKQLYHDREEVTCHLRRLDLKPR